MQSCSSQCPGADIFDQSHNSCVASAVKAQAFGTSKKRSVEDQQDNSWTVRVAFYQQGPSQPFQEAMPVIPLVDGGGISTYYISTTDEASADTLLMVAWSQQALYCKPFVLMA